MEIIVNMNVKSNKKKVIDFIQKKNSSLVNLITKEDKKIKMKTIQDINGMEITFNVIKQKN